MLKGEADAASVFPNSADIGTSREETYAKVLRQHLPPTCTVSLGGFLFNQRGQESKQIDILATNGASIQFNFHNANGSGKSFACVDGAVAVVAVKSTLDSSQLTDALENLESIPEKLPLTNDRKSPNIAIQGYDDWPYKIVYASDGVSLDTVTATLRDFYNARADIPFSRRPNLLHVSGKYIIVRAGPNGGQTRDHTTVKPNSFYGFPEPTNVFGLFHAITAIQRYRPGFHLREVFVH